MDEIRLVGTTAAGGGLTLTAEKAVFGYLEKVVWIDGTLADGVDAVLSVTNTPQGVDETLLTLTDANNDAVYYPRTLEQGLTGVDLTGVAGGDRTRMLIAGLLKLVITAGGNALTGGLIAYVTQEDDS